MRLLAAILVPAYLVLGVATGAWLTLTSFMGCYESCTQTGHWSNHYDSWQWDALRVLGVACIAVTLVGAAALAFRSRVALPAVVVHAATLAVPAYLFGEIWATASWVIVVGIGAAAVYARRNVSGNSRAGARDTRASPSA